MTALEEVNRRVATLKFERDMLAQHDPSSRQLAAVRAELARLKQGLTTTYSQSHDDRAGGQHIISATTSPELPLALPSDGLGLPPTDSFFARDELKAATRRIAALQLECELLKRQMDPASARRLQDVRAELAHVQGELEVLTTGGGGQRS